MIKKIMMLMIVGMLFISLIGFVFAQIDSVVPEGMSGEQFKKLIEEANRKTILERFFSLFAVSNSYWGVCGQDCSALLFGSDCSACGVGETETNCLWSPDSYTAQYPWSSVNGYCDWVLKPEPDYNKQCFCVVASPECSGGGAVGDRKCTGDDVFKCSSQGVWEIYEECDYTCSSGSCSGECSRNSDCGTDGFIGNTYCSNGDAHQKYREWDCAGNNCGYTDNEQLVEDCGINEDCIDGECLISCTPQTCAILGYECGAVDDGCGNTMNCGGCSTGENCNQGNCVSQGCTPNCVGKVCGSDGCSGVCGTCESNEVCEGGICEVEPIKECLTNEDCKTKAEVVCKDGTFWYHSYSCANEECLIGTGEVPSSCKGENPINSNVEIILGVISLISIGGFLLFKKRK